MYAAATTIENAMRAPVDHIEAPVFPPRLPWINVASLRMDQQRGRPVLVEFWDFCRPNSLRTLPYLTAWDERYRDDGLRVIGVHAAGFAPSADTDAVRAAVARLAIAYPVVVDEEFQIWQDYGNLGWPARYLFNQEGRLFDYHYGEGGYDETETRDPGAARRERDRRWSPCGPRISRARCSPPNQRTCPAPTAVPTRPAPCGRSSRARAR